MKKEEPIFEPRSVYTKIGKNPNYEMIENRFRTRKAEECFARLYAQTCPRCGIDVSIHANEEAIKSKDHISMRMMSSLFCSANKKREGRTYTTTWVIPNFHHVEGVTCNDITIECPNCAIMYSVYYCIDHTNPAYQYEEEKEEQTNISTDKKGLRQLLDELLSERRDHKYGVPHGIYYRYDIDQLTDRDKLSSDVIGGYTLLRDDLRYIEHEDEFLQQQVGFCPKCGAYNYFYALKHARKNPDTDIKLGCLRMRYNSGAETYDASIVYTRQQDEDAHYAQIIYDMQCQCCGTHYEYMKDRHRITEVYEYMRDRHYITEVRE